MKIVKRKIEDIFPYENNPRLNDAAVDKTAMSLKEYGWQQPVVVDQFGVIIVGHTRLKAAKKLGFKTCPVLIADKLTGAQVKAYRIADNKTGEMATWEEDLLKIEIEELIDLDFDLELTGFDSSEIEGMLLVGDAESEKRGEPVETLTPNQVIAEKIKQADKIVYQFSGGRDSTLAILKTLELVRDKNPVACYIDTGTEFPDLLYFIYNFCKEHGLPLEVLRPKKNFFEIYGGKKQFPDPVYRDCIQGLINNPVDEIFFSHENALIIRGGRSKQKTSTSKSNIYQEVVRSKNRVRKLLNPLYLLTDSEYAEDVSRISIWNGYARGFIRTACWCCPFQREPQWEALKSNYPLLWDSMREMAEVWEFKKIKGDGCIKQFKKYWDKQL